MQAEALRHSSIKETVFILVILSILSFFCCVGLFIGSGYVLREDWVVPLSIEQLHRALEIYSFPWHSQLLGGWPNISFSNMLFVMLTMAPFMYLFGSMAAAKMWIFVIVLASGFSTYWLSGILVEKKRHRMIAAFLYMFNPWLLGRILSGHQFILLAYVSAPITIGGFIQSLRYRRLKDQLLAGFSLGLTIAFDMHLVGAMVFVIIGVYLTCSLSFKIIRSRGSLREAVQIIKGSIAAFLVPFSLGVLLNSFWIVPYVAFIISHGRAFPFMPSLENVGWFSQVGSLIMQGYFANHSVRIAESALNQVGLKLWYLSGFIIAALAFSATFVESNNRRHALFFSLVAVVGIFMGMGSNHPLGFIYIWLFKNIPFFASFRNPNGFVFPVVLSYSILLSLLADATSKLKLPKINISSRIFCRLLLRIPSKISFDSLLTVTFCGLILSYSFPMLTGDFSGELRPLNLPEYYDEVESFIKENGGDYRVLQLHPWPGPLYDFVPENYFYIQDPIVHLLPNSVVTLGESGLTHDFTRFVLSCLYNNRTEYIGKLLGLLGIRFILVRNDMSYPILWSDLNTSVLTRQLLPTMRGITEKATFGNITVFENSFSYPRLFGSDRIFLVAGDRRVLVSLAAIHQIQLDSLPLIFLQQLDGELSTRTLIEKSDLLVIQNNRIEDLIFENTLDLTSLVSSSSRFNVEWVSSEFVTQGLSDSAGQFEIPGSEVDKWIVTKADEAEVNVPFAIDSEGDYEIWIKLHVGPVRMKTWYSPQGELAIMLDGELIIKDVQPIKDYETAANTLNFQWEFVGKYRLSPGVHNLALINKAHIPWGGLNLVSRVYVGPTVELSSLNSKISLLHVLEAEDMFDISNNGWRISTVYGSSSSFGLCLESYVNSGLDVFTTNSSLRIVRPDNYTVAIRLLSEVENTVRVSIDGYEFDVDLQPSSGFQEYEIGPLKLGNGHHNFSLTTSGEISFDNIFVYNTEERVPLDTFLGNLQLEKDNSVEYTRENPVRYGFNMKNDTRMVVFLETSDPLWKGPGVKVVVYSYANGFLICSSEQARFSVIEYGLYRYELVGVLVSILAVVLIIFLYVRALRVRMTTND